MSEKIIKADVAVIGAGPGGYVAAIQAAQAGLKTVIVEAEHLGGVCLNWGCIPTKAMLKSAEVYSQLKNADKYGVSCDDVSFDLSRIIDRSRGVAQQLSKGVAHLLKKNKVEVVNGYAQFKEKDLLEVTSKEGMKFVKSTHIVIASGAKPRSFPGLQADGLRVWNYKHALASKELPEKLAIIGSGAIGIEFANFYQALGVDVTVIEVMDSILPQEDKDISDYAVKEMSARGMKFKVSTRVTQLDRADDFVKLTIDNKSGSDCLEFSHVITATGVTPNTNDLGLEAVGVSLDESGFIKTNGICQTSIPTIYAIGDVAGAPCLAHKASHEAMTCIAAILDVNKADSLNIKLIPACTYCFPQIASVGYTEAEARETFKDIKVGVFPFQANGKALAIGKPEGFTKVIFNNETGELIGVHMIGEEVTELIQGFSIAQTLEATESELTHTVFAHPTLSEAMHESVLDAYDKAIHI